MILGGSPLSSVPVDGSEEATQTDEVFLIASPAPADPVLTATPHVISVITAS